MDNKRQALERETYWIQHPLQQGIRLTNIKGVHLTSVRKAEKPETGIYYTASEAEEVLGVDYSIFATLRHRGLITPAIPRGTRGGYYLKSGVDQLAANLDKFRRRYGSQLNADCFRK